MLFADDIVICEETREEVERRLESWKYALERRGMKVSRSKTEYLCINGRNDDETVKMEDAKMPRVKEFKCLGSTVQESGGCEREVRKRVQAGWNGWRRVSGVICDRRLPARVKGEVYSSVVRPAMVYGSDVRLGHTSHALHDQSFKNCMTNFCVMRWILLNWMRNITCLG